MAYVIAQEAAVSILNPHAHRFGACLRYGWDQWRQEPAEKRLVTSARTRASWVSDRFRVYGEANFTDISGLEPNWSRGLLLWNVEGRLLVRFKKLRPDLKPSSIPTGQQQAISEQRQIPGLEDGTHIVAGYVLNPDQTDIERIAFVCVVDDRVRWHIDIPEPGSAVAGGGTVLPLRPAPKAPTPVRSKRTPKEGEREDELS